MALDVKVGTFLTGTGAVDTTVVVNDVGFQPKAIIFWWTRETSGTDALSNQSCAPGIGFTTSNTAYVSRAAVTEDAQTSSDTNKNFTNTGCIHVHLATTNVDGILSLYSMDSGGFTLNVLDQFATSYRISYAAFGGTDITNVYTGVATSIPGSTGNSGVTAPGFQPSVVFFSGSRSTTTDLNGTNAEITFGAAVSSSQQGVLGIVGPTGATTIDGKSYCTDVECVGAGATSTPASSMNARASFVSMDTNGFTLNWLEVATGTFDYLAIKGGNWLVGSGLTQTDTSTDIVESGFGFAPSFGMVFSHGKAESTQDTLQSHWSTSVGAFTSTSARVAQASYMEDGTADSESDTAIEYDEVYINIGASDAVVGLMDIKSVDSGGFTFIMDDADPSQAFFWYVAAGGASTGTDLVVQDAYCTSQTDAIVLVQQHSIAAQDASVTSQTDPVVLVQQHNLTATDSFVTSQTDPVTITQASVLVVADANVTTQTDPVILVQQHTLTIQDASCTSQADAIALAQQHVLVAQDASVVSQADAVTLTQAHALIAQDANVTTQADNVVVVQANSLTVQDAFITSQVDAVAVTQTHVLTAQDAFVTSQTDALLLTQVHNLISQDAFVTSQTDAATIVQQHILFVVDAFSETQADEIVIVHNIHIRPSADTYDGTWTNELGTAVDLFESVNDVVANDSDYIQSESNPSSSPVVIALGTATDPVSSSGHIIRYRYMRDGSGTVNLTVQLRQGYVSEVSQGTLIAEWIHNAIGATLVTTEQTLTSGQADSITDYSSLFVRMVASI